MKGLKGKDQKLVSDEVGREKDWRLVACIQGIMGMHNRRCHYLEGFLKKINIYVSKK